MASLLVVQPMAAIFGATHRSSAPNAINAATAISSPTATNQRGFNHVEATPNNTN